MKTVNIKINTYNLNDTAPLYKLYAGQLNPQPAYIVIEFSETAEGEVSITVGADYDTNVGGGWTNQAMLDNREFHIQIPSCALGSAIESALKDEAFREKLTEIGRGYSESYRNYQYVGSFEGWDDERCFSPFYLMEHELMDLECAEIYSAEEWLQDTIVFCDADGNPCDYDDAISAKLQDEIVIDENSNAKLLEEKSAEDLSSNQVAYGLYDFFDYLIFTIIDNKN